MQSFTLPVSYAIKRFKESDFAIETRDKLCIYNDNCTVVLLYSETEESKQLLSVFKVVAESVPGINFAACNVVLENGVAEAFMEVRNNRDHPFNWATMKPFPFILIYRKGYPINFYEGPPEASIFTYFVLNFACNPEFHYTNYLMNQRLKEEMWSNYRIRNPIVIGGPQLTPERQPYVLPAIPFREQKTNFKLGSL